MLGKVDMNRSIQVDLQNRGISKQKEETCTVSNVLILFESKLFALQNNKIEKQTKQSSGTLVYPYLILDYSYLVSLSFHDNNMLTFS